MGYVVGRCPELLSFSVEEVKTRVDFFLQMGMNQKDFGTMVFDYPKILGFFSFEEMEKKVFKAIYVCVLSFEFINVLLALISDKLPERVWA